MQLGLFDYFIIAGFGLWVFFPIALFLSNHQLDANSDQKEQFEKTHSGVIGKADLWEEKVNDWEEELIFIPFENKRARKVA